MYTDRIVFAIGLMVPQVIYAECSPQSTNVLATIEIHSCRAIEFQAKPRLAPGNPAPVHVSGTLVTAQVLDREIRGAQREHGFDLEAWSKGTSRELYMARDASEFCEGVPGKKVKISTQLPCCDSPALEGLCF